MSGGRMFLAGAGDHTWSGNDRCDACGMTGLEYLQNPGKTCAEWAARKPIVGLSGAAPDAPKPEEQGPGLAAKPARCYICGREPHALGVCPYFPHKPSTHRYGFGR